MQINKKKLYLVCLVDISNIEVPCKFKPYSKNQFVLLYSLNDSQNYSMTINTFKIKRKIFYCIKNKTYSICKQRYHSFIMKGDQIKANRQNNQNHQSLFTETVRLQHKLTIYSMNSQFTAWNDNSEHGLTDYSIIYLFTLTANTAKIKYIVYHKFLSWIENSLQRWIHLSD